MLVIQVLLTAPFLENDPFLPRIRIVLLFWLCYVPHFVNAQTATITGVVLDDENRPLKQVNIQGQGVGTYSDTTGFYTLQITSHKETTISFTHLGYRPVTLDNLVLSTDEIFEFGPVLTSVAIPIDGVTVLPSDKKNAENLNSISAKLTRKIPGANAGVENILKLLPGTSSSNELSTQYSVRGGNYDENLIYINGIEVYRPFLVRSGQQEGLSIINPAMVSNIRFSAGGFQAKYGDKLASVLDIQYKLPSSFETRFDVSLLGASATIESVSKNHRFSSISGIRYRNNGLLVNSQQTKTNFKPTFIDFQTYNTFRFSSSFHVDFLGHAALNDYRNEPLSRQTNFGTLSNPQLLAVQYKGDETNRYNTLLGGLKATYYLNGRTTLKFVASAYKTVEEEHSNISAAYRLGQVNPIDGDGTPQNLDAVQDVGFQLSQAQNRFDAVVMSVGHKGSHGKGDKKLDWGLVYNHEVIQDRLHEYQLTDSTSVSVSSPLPELTHNPSGSTPASLSESSERRWAENSISNNRLSAYVQFGNRPKFKKADVYYNIGIRSQLWSIGGKAVTHGTQLVVSPRIQLAIKPHWQKDMLFRLASGLYQQPPFYRELRGPTGTVHSDVKAQKSYQIVLGHEYFLLMFERPFTFIGEVYFKHLWHINPYSLNDVRIRYTARNNAKARAYGAELRLNGAFVPGTESWLTIGFLRALENIEERGYIDRPTDRRFKLGILFQDYIPQYPNFKMYLNLVYNTGMPGGSPQNADPYLYQNRLRDYKRADLGISHIFVGENRTYPKNHWLHFFKELTSGIEIFNLFNNQNSITNTWIRDVARNTNYAVPNFMTPRVFNVRLTMRL